MQVSPHYLPPLTLGEGGVRVCEFFNRRLKRAFIAGTPETYAPFRLTAKSSQLKNLKVGADLKVGPFPIDIIP